MKADNHTCLEAIAALQALFIQTHDREQTGLEFVKSLVALTQSRCGLLSLVPAKTPAQWNSRHLFQERFLAYMPGTAAPFDFMDSLQYHHIQDMCAHAVEEQDIFIQNSLLIPTDDLPDRILPIRTVCVIPLFFQHRLMGICICCNRKEGYTKDSLLELQPLLEAFTMIHSNMAPAYSPKPEEVLPCNWAHSIDETNPRLVEVINTTLGIDNQLHPPPGQDKVRPGKENTFTEACQVIVSNLEILEGLFEIQKLFAPHPQLAASFQENSIRLKALSIVYKLHALSGEEGQVNLNQYLHKWMPAFSVKMNLQTPVIIIDELCPDVTLPVDQAIACILLLNEVLLLLASPAVRDAHTHKIFVSAFREQDVLQLSIISDTKDTREIISSQMRFALIRTWAELLNASEKIEITPVLCFDYRFTMNNT